MEDHSSSRSYPASALHGRATEGGDGWYAKHGPRCDCGRLIATDRPGTAWYACGEYGEDVRYICPRCTALPGFVLRAGNGSTDSQWSDFTTPRPTTQSGDHEEPHAGNSGTNKETDQ